MFQCLQQCASLLYNMYLCILSSSTPALLHACQSRPKGCVTPVSTWYSNIQKACYVHTEVVPADVMQATHIASEVLQTPSSDSECTELWHWLWLFCSCQTGYRCGKVCHHPFLPHVLVTAMLLKSLPQLTEGAINIHCACWTRPDFWSVAYHLSNHILAYQKTVQSNIRRQHKATHFV